MVGSQSELSVGSVATPARGEASVAGAGSRLVSLDAFRGLTIACMMLVNNAGNDHVYEPLEHAAWHGWTFTDTVFPFFLWIAGVSMTFSFAKRVEAGADRGKLLLHALRRAALIFFLGLLLNGFPLYNLSTLRIPGVLQRIAICYFLAAAIFLYTSRRVMVWLTFGFLIAYWALMTLVPVPGHGVATLEREGNLEQYVDSLFLSGHMYSRTKTWDPEGILSTLPAISTALFGVLTGHLLRSSMGALEKVAWVFFSGNILFFVGAWWGTIFPINKQLWTSSFVLLMAGLALCVFGCCFWLIDILGYKKWAKPLVIYGSNAIVVYALSGIFARIEGRLHIREPINAALEVIASPINASFLHGLGYVLLLYCVSWVLYRKGWFLRF